MTDALMWSMALLGLGILLIVLEVFIPSGGVLGILAVLAIVASLVVAFVDGFKTGAVMLVVVSIVIPLTVGAAIRWWPYTPIGRRIILHAPASEEDVLPDNEEYRELQALVGRTGIAKTKMLPSGAVTIDGEVWDAVSDGAAIEPGQPIRVVALRTNHLIVRLELPNVEIPAAEDVDFLSRPADSLGLDSLDESTS